MLRKRGNAIYVGCTSLVEENVPLFFLDTSLCLTKECWRQYKAYDTSRSSGRIFIVFKRMETKPIICGYIRLLLRTELNYHLFVITIDLRPNNS